MLGLAILAAATLAGPGPKPASVKVDTSRVVDVTAWARDSKRLAEQWYPRIAQILGSEPETRPAIRLIFAPTEGVAGTAGADIHINTDWIMRHPDDRGMVIHELVHVLQAYPKYDPGWLVEGIADYVRWWKFEAKPVGLPRTMARASYRDGYRISGAFIAYAEHRKPGTVKALNAALRKSAYTGETFREITGYDLDTLWSDFARAWDAGEFTPEKQTTDQ